MTPSEKKSIYILNGPNLNRLGTREPHIYGHNRLADIERLCADACKVHNAPLVFRQSNHEGMLIDWVHEAADHGAGLVINAGALSHTSFAIADALKLCSIPVIEVHLSNIAARESFRADSVLSRNVDGVIFGLGADGYVFAVTAILDPVAPPPGTGET